MNTLYDILEVSPAASNEVIKAAYKMLTMRYHPDRNQNNPGAEACQKRLNSAYDVLSDPIKRKAYDESLTAHHRASATSEEAPSAKAEQATAPRQEPPFYSPPHPLSDEPRNPWLLVFMLTPAIVIFICMVIAGVGQVL